MNLSDALYREKLSTAREIAGALRDGDHIFLDVALSQPSQIILELADRFSRQELRELRLHTMLDPRLLPCYRPDFAERFHPTSWFTTAASKKAVNLGLADIMPCTYSDVGNLIEDYIDVDYLFAVVSPMDGHGYFSFGTTASALDVLVKKAKKIVVEVNPNMPRTFGAAPLHISQVHALYESDTPMPTVEASEIDGVSRTIGGYIAEEIPDGAILQLGIGSIPDAVGQALKNKRHLGIHSEMLTDSMIDLLECGAVDNSLKPFHRGKSVATFAFGSEKMYNHLNDNPAFEFYPARYVNDPHIIAQYPRFVSVNSAIEVDFLGQVCAEGKGTTHISGSGGQLDFVRGAIHSKGGRSFIAFASTAKGGAESRIQSVLTPGAPVTTGKNEVDYIVTEYGLAKLRGRSLSQRTKALISIAHPAFRDQLLYEARKRNIII